MMFVKYPKVIPFTFEPSLSPAIRKKQALKVLEEASELVEAIKDGSRSHALYEFADVLQALGNLASVMDFGELSLAMAYEDVKQHNIERGRYEGLS